MFTFYEKQTPQAAPIQNNNEHLNVDVDKILIEVGITTPVLTSNTAHGYQAQEDPKLNNINNNMTHQYIAGQSKSIIKK